MKNHNKRYWILSIAAFLCGLLIGGCNPFPDTVEPLTMMPTQELQATAFSTTEPPAMTPTPTRQATATAAVEPSIAAPTPILDLQTYGSLLYLDGRSVWEGLGLASDRLVVELPFEQVYAAALMDDNLWVLADDQLAVVNLTSGMVETVAEIELSDWGGQLLVLWGRQSVAYAVGIDDDSTLLGHSTRVGLYNPRTSQAHMLTKLVGTVSLLGATSKEDALYAAQIGGNGSGPILTINLEDGTTTTRIESQALSFSAAMSSDGHWVSMIDAKDWSQPEEQGCITLYNLAEPDTSPMAIELPKQPSHARDFRWSPDSQYLYFVLCHGPWAGYSGQPLMQTYGLWRADIRSGEVEEITPSIQVDYYPAAVSPDGRVVLIDNTTFTLVDVQTGAERFLDLPQGARILTWRIPDAQ